MNYSSNNIFKLINLKLFNEVLLPNLHVLMHVCIFQHSFREIAKNYTGIPQKFLKFEANLFLTNVDVKIIFLLFVM